MKKIFLIFLVLIFSLYFVSAAQATPTSFADSLVKLITGAIDVATRAGGPLFGALFGDVQAGSDLFVKTLIFLLVLLVVSSVLQTIDFFQDRYWIQFFIGAIISILGIRFLPQDFIESITLPSSAFVAAVAIGFPLVLYGFLMERLFKDKPHIRRAGWVLFGVIITVLWSYNYDKPFFWIYPGFILACILAFLFFTLPNHHYQSHRHRHQKIVSCCSPRLKHFIIIVN